PTPTLIRPRVPTPVQKRAGLASGLPPDMLRDMAGRLGTVGLMFAAAEAVGIAVTQAFAVMGWSAPGITMIWARVAGLALGVIINRLARIRALTPGQLLAVGLAFEVVGGFVVVLPEAYYHVVSAPHGHEMALSWLTVWIAIFPILLPASPAVAVA